MVQTDPIADLLTRIRNAQRARHVKVDVPCSKMKVKIAEILQREGYIGRTEIIPGKPGKMLRIGIKYVGPRKPLIQEIDRISKPGCRIYASLDDIASWKNGIRTTILSTSKGIMTHQDALEARLGGEVIMRIQ